MLGVKRLQRLQYVCCLEVAMGRGMRVSCREKGCPQATEMISTPPVAALLLKTINCGAEKRMCMQERCRSRPCQGFFGGRLVQGARLRSLSVARCCDGRLGKSLRNRRTSFEGRGSRNVSVVADPPGATALAASGAMLEPRHRAEERLILAWHRYAICDARILKRLNEYFSFEIHEIMRTLL